MLLGVSYIVDTYSYAILYHNCSTGKCLMTRTAPLTAALHAARAVQGFEGVLR